MEKKFFGYYVSPIGTIEIVGTENHITSIGFVKEVKESDFKNEIIQEAINQLEEYFHGKRETFELKLYLDGTDFQKKVWKELMNIPYANTISYKELAERIGNEKACRAVGNANNKNKIGIVIPCHRVIGSSGKLVGYAGGMDKKQWLLDHEKNK